MAKSKYSHFVVWKGRKPGVYQHWEDCEEQVKGFAGALFKGFTNKSEAEEAYLVGPSAFQGKSKNTKPATKSNEGVGYPNPLSLSVDAACSGNPGRLEYRGVDTGTGAEVFRVGPFEEGTVNIGEFLAIVHGLAFLKERGLGLPIYSDSKTAIKWVKDKQTKTKLVRRATNDYLFQLIERAENWLRKNTWPNKILKWETAAWGEIPADFGRK